MREERLNHLSVKIFPGSSNASRVMFYFHGFPGPLPELNPKPYLAPQLNSTTGFEIVAPEYSGLGESGGTFTFSGSLSEAEQVFQHYLRQYPQADFTILGYSWGALPAICVWRNLAELQRGRLILLAPAIVSPGRTAVESIASSWLAQFRQVLSHYTEPTQIAVDIEECLALASPLDVLRESARLTTVIHGSDDDVVPLAVSQAVCAQIPSLKLVVLEGQGHDFLNRVELAETIAHELA